MGELINEEFEKFQQDLEIREKCLKNFVSFSLDDDIFLELTNLSKNDIGDEINRRVKDTNDK